MVSVRLAGQVIPTPPSTLTRGLPGDGAGRGGSVGAGGGIVVDVLCVVWWEAGGNQTPRLVENPRDERTENNPEGAAVSSQAQQ